jgi:hypothetical protein
LFMFDEMKWAVGHVLTISIIRVCHPIKLIVRISTFHLFRLSSFVADDQTLDKIHHADTDADLSFNLIPVRIRTDDRAATFSLTLTTISGRF